MEKIPSRNIPMEAAILERKRNLINDIDSENQESKTAANKNRRIII